MAIVEVPMVHDTTRRIVRHVGLAVSEHFVIFRYDQDGRHPDLLAYRWRLTHRGSTRLLAWVRSPAVARRIAAELEALPVDWEFGSGGGPSRSSKTTNADLALVARVLRGYHQRGELISDRTETMYRLAAQTSPEGGA